MKNKWQKLFLLFLLFISYNNSMQAEEEMETTSFQEYYGDYDPWEGMNRRIYHFNYGFDKYVFLPITKAYQWITPNYVEDRVHHFLENTKSVSVLGNSLLQTKGRKSMRSLARLSINTVLGLGGLFDVASKLGMPKPYEDFGLTLQHYGVPRGPYLVLPILGPKYLRDAFGMAVDSQMLGITSGIREVSSHPLRYGVQAVDTKAHSSFRFYGTNSPFEYEYIRFLHKKYRTLQEETHQNINIGGI